MKGGLRHPSAFRGEPLSDERISRAPLKRIHLEESSLERLERSHRAGGKASIGVQLLDGDESDDESDDEGDAGSIALIAGRTAALPRIAQFVESQMPVIRGAYALEDDRRATRDATRRTLELIQEQLHTFDNSMPLLDWIRALARRAVEEGVVTNVQRGGPSAARRYCCVQLKHGIRCYHQHYVLRLSAAEREGHVREAEQLLDERLAAFDGSRPFHRWIRLLPHKFERNIEPGTEIERRGMETLDDWLELLARLVVERYVVAEMIRDPHSHLAALNLIWVAQRVGEWHHTPCGSPPDPYASLDDIWRALLAPVPETRREAIRIHTSDACLRILRGLPGFKFESMLDTWRTTIVRNTLSTSYQREKQIKAREQSISASSYPGDDEEVEWPHELIDDGESLEANVVRSEHYCEMLEMVMASLDEDPVKAQICVQRLQGVRAKEVARAYGVPSRYVDTVFSQFRRRAGALARARRVDQITG
jgi:DNA-directed RNA polymerase specialized sigma24 family protein